MEATQLRRSARNADLTDFVRLLQEQHAHKVDVVTTASNIRAESGLVRLSDIEVIIDDDGVTDPNGLYRPTEIADEGFASKLNIPLAYVRRLRGERVDLWDLNVNGWLHGEPHGERDGRTFLVRAFRGDGDENGYMRALLSDRFSLMDNLDAAVATLEGVRAAGVHIDVTGCDLSERRMSMRLRCPEINVMAPALFAGYRSPFTLQAGEDNPIVDAGLIISNSETGGGAYNIVPYATARVCSNGMTITKKAMRSVHLGSKLEEGTIRWSHETQQRAVELIRSKTKDAVEQFLSTEFLQGVVDEMTRKAGEEVESDRHARVIAKTAQFTDEQIDGILAHFVRSGQMTVGGVYHAATAFTKSIADPDEAFEAESKAAAILGV